MNVLERIATSICSLAASMSVAAAHAQATGAAPAELLPASCTPPLMPESAARAGAHGTTEMRIHVDATGKATKVDIARSSGALREHKLLDRTAATAFARCSFKAALDENGRPVEDTVSFSYTWAFH